jgi:hypothetical protein
MKFKTSLFSFSLLLLSACTRSIPVAAPSEEPSATADSISEPALETPVALLEDTPLPTATQSSTPEAATATASQTAPPSETATATSTATLPPFEADSAYGSPTFLDTFADGRNWSDANDLLPDTDFIQLALGTGQLHVTGKPSQFDTWWFTSTSAGDYFIQMQVELDDCSGKQAYGLILRGPESNSSARGYILTFSCDGAYRLVRLDGLNPYSAAELIPWTASDAINVGANQSNLLGIRLVGNVITLFANESQLEELEDDSYSAGRFGLFVNAGVPGDFTYRIEELAFWNLD